MELEKPERCKKSASETQRGMRDIRDVDMK